MASYDGATLKVTEIFSKAILLPMLVYGACMAVCSILYTCQQLGVAEIAKSTNFKEGPHTFVFIVYVHIVGVK